MDIREYMLNCCTCRFCLPSLLPMKIPVEVFAGKPWRTRLYYLGLVK